MSEEMAEKVILDKGDEDYPEFEFSFIYEEDNEAGYFYDNDDITYEVSKEKLLVLRNHLNKLFGGDD